ncbi:hypothetical protein D3C75_1124120 [compost metagenome]
MQAGASGWTSGPVRSTKTASRRPAAGSAPCFHREAGGLVRKKKPVDPVRQANKNRGYRIGWLIALAGIVCGFALVALKQG